VGVSPVTLQKMRWAEPGTFWTGSPEEEPERFADEGPRHLVTLSEGFWLADTACSQALWVAIIGANPSGFKGEQLPSSTAVAGVIARPDPNDHADTMRRLSHKGEFSSTRLTVLEAFISRLVS